MGQETKSLRVHSIKLKPEKAFISEGKPNRLLLKREAAKFLKAAEKDIREIEIIKYSIDARKKPDIYVLFSLNVTLDEKAASQALKRCSGEQVTQSEQKRYHFPESGTKKMPDRPVIIGMGPAGLFCAYELALHGYRPIILERGADVDERTADVASFWDGGRLKTESNVQFGEGGAGTFSDGKLNTLIKDKDGRNREVLRIFCEFGADESILYDYKPHIGTDVLVRVVKRMREKIIALGGEVHFHSKMVDFQTCGNRITKVITQDKKEISCGALILAIGHSARDTFRMLYEKQIPMEAKSFAVGLRVEHFQKFINDSQYGSENAEILGAAPYKLTARTVHGRGVYSFCMCPGGYVVNASSQENRLAVNGMSYSGRDAKNANSAIIVTVTPEDFESDHPLAGIAFQEKLEEKAYQAGNGTVPVEYYTDFKSEVRGNTPVPKENRKSTITPCIKGKYSFAKVSGILPEELAAAFVEGMEQFDKKIPGFAGENVLVEGVESRTSSPVRIPRNEKLIGCYGNLYPCGEGAGYAGGITSAAMDGMRVAEMLALEYTSFES